MKELKLVLLLLLISSLFAYGQTVNISTVLVGGQGIPQDGVTPVNDWIIQANTDCPNGGTVFFDTAASTYIINHPDSGGPEVGLGVSYSGKMNVTGNGKTFDFNGKTLRLANGSYDSYPSLVLTGSNNTATNFIFDGNRGNTAGSPCIGCSSLVGSPEGAVNPTVSNFTIQNTTTLGISMDRAVGGWTIRDGNFLQIGEHVMYFSSGFDGVGLLENILVDEFAINFETQFPTGRDINIFKSSAYDPINNGTGTADGSLTVINLTIRREERVNEGSNILNFTTSSKYNPSVFDNITWVDNLISGYDPFYLFYASDDEQVVYLRNSDLNGAPLFYDVVNTIEYDPNADPSLGRSGYGYENNSPVTGANTETNEHYFIENTDDVDIGRYPSLVSGWNGGNVVVSDVVDSNLYGRIDGGPNTNRRPDLPQDSQGLTVVNPVKYSNLTWENQETLVQTRLDSDYTFNGIDFTKGDGNPVMTMYESRGGQTARTLRVKNCNCNLTNGSTLLNAAASTNTIVIFEDNNTGNCDLVSNESNYASVTRNAASTGGLDPLPGGSSPPGPTVPVNGSNSGSLINH